MVLVTVLPDPFRWSEERQGAAETPPPSPDLGEPRWAEPGSGIPYLLFHSVGLVFVLWLDRILPNLPVRPHRFRLPAAQEHRVVRSDRTSELSAGREHCVTDCCRHLSSGVFKTQAGFSINLLVLLLVSGTLNRNSWNSSRFKKYTFTAIIWVI